MKPSTLLRYSSNLLLFASLLVSFICANAARANLVRNPGFENTKDSAWIANNWAQWEYEVSSDPRNSHSGRWSQKIVINRRKAAGDFEFIQKVPVRGGMSLSLAFWMRAQNPASPVRVLLRQQRSPYKEYFSANITPSAKWEKFTHTFTLRDNIDEENIVLMFKIRDETTIWLDDVSLTPLPPRSEEQPVAGKILHNGSFEVGRDGWVAKFRERNFPQITLADAADEANAGLSLVSIPDTAAPDGKRVLAFEVAPPSSVTLTSGFFHLRYGHPVKISFWLKANAPGLPFRAALGGGHWETDLHWDRASFTATTEWKRYEFTSTPRLNSTGSWIFELSANHPGRYRIDNISVSEIELVEETTSASVTAGFESLPDSDPANLFDKDQPATFRLNVLASAPVRLRAVVTDIWNHVIKTVPLSATPGDSEIARIEVSLPTHRYGGFKCSVYPDTGTRDQEFASVTPLTELVYSVLPRLKPPGESQDFFFGGHVHLTDYNLHIARRAGFRWLRLHTPLSTKWMTVEPAKGEWHFVLDGVKRAHAAGFRIMGNFDTTPWFYADADSGKEKDSTWHHSWPPADWTAWRNYVQKTAVAFGPYVQAWEVWNEPDTSFLRIPKGKDRAPLYRQLVRETRAALDDARIDTTLLAGAVMDSRRPLTREVLPLGAGDDINGYSFHDYSGMSPDQSGILGEIDHIRTFRDRHDQPLPVWHSEGGIRAIPWQERYRPQNAITNVADYAALMVRSASYWKAAGVKTFFHYSAYAHPAGTIPYRLEWNSSEPNGIPQPAIAAHAAMVGMLEDATGAGIDTLKGGTVTRVRFIKNGRSIDVVWSTVDTPLESLPELNYRHRLVCDIMGNPLTMDTHAIIDRTPVYLLER
ncbi:putative carbohydrate binding protein [Opitutaceae bacterium TAV1]|nr:putative carbohydrate binding protein [Opitutaceae bacterium TAV1]